VPTTKRLRLFIFFLFYFKRRLFATEFNPVVLELKHRKFDLVSIPSPRQNVAAKSGKQKNRLSIAIRDIERWSCQARPELAGGTKRIGRGARNFRIYFFLFNVSDGDGVYLLANNQQTAASLR